ncbi:macrophage receptor MARCO isoform X2 [Oncorhynchus mykiss]|uniref:macrophage receptor MARCO isoform X2 n=1 Tax=Oncorhynchus mykiss TaxID=8022 RepID=UPI001878B896|nr:macrophage receptor MARCO isoform X2 [Oncorhynchus mykiss]
METSVERGEDHISSFYQSNPLLDLDMKLSRTDMYTFQSSDLKPAKARGAQRCLNVIAVYLVLLTALNIFLLYKVFSMESSCFSSSGSRTTMLTDIHIPLGMNQEEDLRTLARNTSLESNSLRGDLGRLQTQVSSLCGEDGQLGQLRTDLGVVNASTTLLQDTVKTLRFLKASPGPQGPIGPPGARGATGVRGEKGDTGETGQKGDPGVDGQTGAKGKPGEPGPKGEDGATGPQGPAGAPDSAATNCSGPPGLPGPQGPKGDMGHIGLPGISGQNGTKGDTGVQGRDGVKGARGLKGNTGLTGEPGPIGPEGPRGPAGVNGTRGLAGLPGLQGSPGSQGPRGEKGERAAGPVNVRIVGGGARGRVEVMWLGQWGTVCDDSFDTVDGTVLCKTLGYQRASAVFTASPGVGKIWFDDLRCTGTEASVFDCPHNGMGINNCQHNEDAGVQCV